MQTRQEAACGRRKREGAAAATCANCVLPWKVALPAASASKIAAPPSPAAFMASMSAGLSAWFALPASCSCALFLPRVPSASHCAHSSGEPSPSLLPPTSTSSKS
jgi:hypothetical protein